MSPFEKLLLRILRGSADANIGFDELCNLLAHLGFSMRVRGSHHLFSKPGIAELINLQRDGRDAKPYQVKQVREPLINLLRPAIKRPWGASTSLLFLPIARYWLQKDALRCIPIRSPQFRRRLIRGSLETSS